MSIENFKNTEEQISKDQSVEIRFKNEESFLIFNGSELKLPTEIGKKIQFLLQLENELNEDIPDNKLVKLHESFNCHKTVLYLLGLLGERDIITKKERDKGHGIQFLNNEDYTEYKDASIFEGSVRENLGDSLGVIQQVDKSKYGHGLLVVHSFLVGVNSEGNIICFEKMNSGGGSPFQVVELNKLYDNNSRYGIIKIEDINRQKLSEDIKNYNELENSSAMEESSMQEELLDISYRNVEGYPIDGSYEDKFMFKLRLTNE